MHQALNLCFSLLCSPPFELTHVFQKSEGNILLIFSYLLLNLIVIFQTLITAQINVVVVSQTFS